MSESGDWGPAPPGMDLSERQDSKILGAVTVVMILGIFSVALRVYARTKSGAGLAADDYFIFAALINSNLWTRVEKFVSVGTAICCLLCVANGGGQHLWAMTFEEFTIMWKITYAFVIIFATSVTITKLSILFFYKRIFGTNWVYYLCMGLVVGYEVAIVIAFLAGCRPISYFWEFYTNPDAEGYMMNMPLFYFANGVCASIIDVAILLVPLPTFLKLKMTTSKKLSVYGILLLGAFVCFAGIFRIVACDKLSKTEDVSWAMAEVFIWSCCEPFIGIVCACLPCFAPLVKRWRQRTQASGSGSGSHGATGGSYGGTKLGTTSKIRVSRMKSNWSRLGNDEEMQLTHISRGNGRNMNGGSSLGTKDSDDDIAFNTVQDIVVKKQFSVVTTPTQPQGAENMDSRKTRGGEGF